MNIPDSATLRKAIAITTKIESLQEKLRRLFQSEPIKSDPEDNNYNSELLIGIAKEMSRRGRPPKNSFAVSKKEDYLAKKKSPRPSSLKGKPRATSPSGPLGDAVFKILEEHGVPMKVGQIFEALAKKNYQWTAQKPLQTLYIRMPKLRGIIRVDNGKYGLPSIPFVPVKRGRKAKNNLPVGNQISSSHEAASFQPTELVPVHQPGENGNATFYRIFSSSKGQCSTEGASHSGERVPELSVTLASTEQSCQV